MKHYVIEIRGADRYIRVTRPFASSFDAAIYSTFVARLGECVKVCAA